MFCCFSLQSKLIDNAGMRRTVEGIMVVHEHGHPHILMLQIANAFFKLPGDYLTPGETDEPGLKKRLDDRLAPLDPTMFEPHEGALNEWEIGDCLAQWWRPNFETFMVSGALTRYRLEFTIISTLSFLLT